MIFEEDPNHKYKKIKDPSNGKYHYRCCSTRIINGQIVQCSFQRRYDHFKSYLEHQQPHECKFELRKANTRGTLLQYIQQKDTKPEISFDGLLTEIARCIGTMNLSTTFGGSEQLRRLIVYAAALGSISLNGSNSPLEQAQEIFPHFNRKDIRNRIITLAHDIKSESITKLDNLSYVSIAADEGSTRGTKNMDFVAECPGSDLHSFPILTLRMDSLFASSYARVFNAGLRIIHSYNINIGSIIVDGHRGQLKALNPKWRYSIFRTSNCQWLESIIVIPCVCHRIHNSFKASSKINIEINNALEALHESAENLRKNVIKIGAICPPHVPTRWINDADIAFFHMKHDIPFNYSDELIPILIIFKTLIIEFEDSKAYISSVYPRLEAALEALSELDTKGNRFAKSFHEALNRYTLGSNEAGIWLLAYLFTPSGHSYFRKRILLNHPKPYGNDFLSQFRIDKLIKKDELEEIIEELVEDNVSNIIDANEPPEQEEPHLLNEEMDLIDEPIRNDDDIDDGDVSDEDEEAMPDIAQYTVLKLASDFLKECIMKQGIDNNSANEMVNLFQSALISTKEEHPLYSMKDDRYNWAFIRSSLPNWNVIADIALRFEATVPSEAACEREISQQRLIHTARRMRTKRDLLNARLVLVQTKNQ